MNKCIQSNSIGTHAVLDFCLKNKIKLIYSATSASIGNKGNDKNLSPYAFTKSKNIELLNNLRKWFNFKFEILYFYNVYGPKQITKGDMATVIGIFENQYKNKKPITVVKPGSQSRKFTHIYDTIYGCYYAWKKNLNRHYSLSNSKAYSILEVAKMFSTKVKFIKPRLGERKKSSIVKNIGKLKIYNVPCRSNLKTYIQIFKYNHNK